MKRARDEADDCAVDLSCANTDAVPSWPDLTLALPLEVLFELSGFLSYGDLARAARVCKVSLSRTGEGCECCTQPPPSLTQAWFAFFASDGLWSRIFAREYGSSDLEHAALASPDLAPNFEANLQRFGSPQSAVMRFFGIATKLRVLSGPADRLVDGAIAEAISTATSHCVHTQPRACCLPRLFACHTKMCCSLDC